ncbi:unnamed protein product, partial [Rotaria socialis]
NTFGNSTLQYEAHRLSKAMFTILNQVALILELIINSRFKQLFSQRFISIQIEINSNIPTL